jgi:hypothetical protein
MPLLDPVAVVVVPKDFLFFSFSLFTTTITFLCSFYCTPPSLVRLSFLSLSLTPPFQKKMA